MAHLIKVDLNEEFYSCAIDEGKKRYPELLDGKQLLVTNTPLLAAGVVQRYENLADIERGFRVLKSDRRAQRLCFFSRERGQDCNDRRPPPRAVSLTVTNHPRVFELILVTSVHRQYRHSRNLQPPCTICVT